MPLSKHRPRVLHVVRQYRPSIGGMETYVEELAARQTQDFEVQILTLNRVFGTEKVLPEREVLRGIEVIRVPFIGGKRAFIPNVSHSLLADADIIHIHGADQLMDTVSFMSRFTKAAVFMTTHGLFFHTEALKRVKQAYFRSITPQSLGRMTEIFSCSGNDQAKLKEIGIESRFFPNPIVPIENDLLCHGDEFLYLGRLAENKRIDRLLTFIAYLKERGVHAHLNIVGADQDNLGPSLRAEAAANTIADQVSFHGFVTHDELVQICRMCGYCISASSFEGFGMAMVEGMSVGLMPVMHRNEAFSEIHRRSGVGLTLDFDRPQEAASLFLGWRDSITPTEREVARDFARQQSWETAAEEVRNSYLKALSSEADQPAAHRRERVPVSLSAGPSA